MLHLCAADRDRLASSPELLGSAFENFACMELIKQLGWSETRGELFYLRTADGREVDFVIEKRNGDVVGIEIKASATLSGKEFKGLRWLREKVGDRLRAGVVLYSGQESVAFGDRLWAVPVSAIYS